MTSMPIKPPKIKNGITISSSGTQFFYKDDRLVWVLYRTGNKYYYEPDISRVRYHREDGPAIEFKDDIIPKQWWYNGKQLDCKTQEEFEQLLKLKAFW
jgi:hypothetical protein